MALLGFSNPFPFTKSLSFVFIPLLKLALKVGLPLVEVLVCSVGPLIFLSRFSDHFLLSLLNFAVIALLSFARGTQSIRLQKMSEPFSCSSNKLGPGAVASLHSFGPKAELGKLEDSFKLVGGLFFLFLYRFGIIIPTAFHILQKS